MFCRFILTCLLWCFAGAHINHTHEIKAEMLKQKWGVENVIRDLDHIKEDLASVIELVDVGKISEKELAFYIIRMHDFDENGGLDGIELRVATEHSMDHNLTSELDEEEKQERIEKVIDNVLEWDLNDDGFVDYAELKQQFERSKRESEDDQK